MNWTWAVQQGRSTTPSYKAALAGSVKASCTGSDITSHPLLLLAVPAVFLYVDDNAGNDRLQQLAGKDIRSQPLHAAADPAAPVHVDCQIKTGTAAHLLKSSAQNLPAHWTGLNHTCDLQVNQCGLGQQKLHTP